MVYAEVFEAAQQPDYAADGGYVQYREIARTVKRLKHAGDPATPTVLLAQVRSEAQRIAEWIKKRVATLRCVGEALRQECVQQKLHRAEARDRAEALRYEALRFHEARCLNADAMKRVADRFKAYTLLPPPPAWAEIEDGAGLLDVPLDHVWYCLSSVFSYARGDDVGQSKVADAGGESQDFVRRSVKYWVHKQDLPFIIAQVLEHLPISAFKDTYSADGPYSLGSSISSVYFDNSHFGMYHKRMRRVEHASLFRIRWYGDEQDIKNPDREVFMELKVHHEAWSGEASTKKRFNLKNKDVDAYLSGDLPLTDQVERLERKGTSESGVRKFQNLATQMLTLVTTEQLRPALRTEYDRCAFQRGLDQSVRISIDTKLRMRAEDLGASKHWMSHEEAVDPRHKIDFPYAVVEVKLQCAENDRIPQWVEELMSCRFMESIPKFSKYAHGVAALYGQSKFVRLMPYWLHQVDADIRAATKQNTAELDLVQGLAIGQVDRTIDRAIFGLGPAVAPRRALQWEQKKLTPLQLMHLYLQMAAGKDQTDVQPTPEQIAASVVPLQKRHDEYDARRVWASQEPLDRNREVTCCDEPGNENEAFGDIPGQTAKRVKVPQRYDPKTFFTAERYFLRWTQSGLMLGLAGLFVIHFGDVSSLPLTGYFWAQRMHVTLGVVMLGIAISALLYSIVQYHARTRRMYARVKVRFDDEMGPSGLTAATVVGLFVLGAMHVFERFGHLSWVADPFS